jgi:hypothetical protein
MWYVTQTRSALVVGPKILPVRVENDRADGDLAVSTFNDSGGLGIEGGGI